MTTPIMTSVISSNVEKVGHDEDNQELHVVFNNGKRYKYSDVSLSDYRDMLASESIGSFITHYIKPFHKCELVGIE